MSQPPQPDPLKPADARRIAEQRNREAFEEAAAAPPPAPRPPPYNPFR